MYKFIDLFSGLGGFRIALQKKGMTCVFSSEIDKDVRDAYIRNFKDKPAGDIKEVSESEIPKHNILCAGFPCQPFSISGSKKGLSDERGRLFYDIIRIARYHQPYVLLLENVKNILSIEGGKVIKTIESKLREINYRVIYTSLNSSQYGIPQKRERVYFVCLRNDLRSPKRLNYNPPKPIFKEVYLKDIIEDFVDNKLYIERDDIVLNKKNLNKKALKPIRIGYLNKGGQGERIYSINGHSITLSATGGGVGAKTGLYFVNNKIRRLSLNECKSLMTFPKSHIVSAGAKGYKQLGNAVMPKMIGRIYDSIVIE